MVFSVRIYGFVDCLAQVFQKPLHVLRELKFLAVDKSPETNRALPKLAAIQGQARPSLKSKVCNGGILYIHITYGNPTIFLCGQRNQENIAINEFNLVSALLKRHMPQRNCEVERESHSLKSVWSFEQMISMQFGSYMQTNFFMKGLTKERSD